MSKRRKEVIKGPVPSIDTKREFAKARWRGNCEWNIGGVELDLQRQRKRDRRKVQIAR